MIFFVTNHQWRQTDYNSSRKKNFHIFFPIKKIPGRTVTLLCSPFRQVLLHCHLWKPVPAQVPPTQQHRAAPAAQPRRHHEVWPAVKKEEEKWRNSKTNLQLLNTPLWVLSSWWDNLCCQLTVPASCTDTPGCYCAFHPLSLPEALCISRALLEHVGATPGLSVLLLRAAQAGKQQRFPC